MIVYKVVCFNDKNHNKDHSKIHELKAELHRVEERISDINNWMFEADEFRCKMIKKKACIENEIASMKIADVESYPESREN